MSALAGKSFSVFTVVWVAQTAEGSVYDRSGVVEYLKLAFKFSQSQRSWSAQVFVS